MNTEKQIEFDRIKEKWSAFAYTDYAKKQIEEVRVILEEAELRKQQRDTSDSREMIEKLGNPPLQNVTELREILALAEKGNCLTPYQLERVENVLVVVERLRDYLKRGKAFDNPLAYYDENLDTSTDLREEIGRQIRNEAVDDHASDLLQELRSEIVKLEESMKQKAETVIRNNRECMADGYYTLRNGRICVPVKKEYRYKIAGSVMDKSSTGNTVFVEPAGVLKTYEELQELRLEEENEIFRILYTLSAMIHAATPVLEENLRMIEKLDFIFSKGKLSAELEATEPVIGTDRRIELVAARHPLMEKAVAIPLDFTVGEDIRGVVITGPNTGGKTVAIKTVMLNCYMAQCGLHVTAKQAHVCMNSHYLSDIGDNQNLSENLSTFSAHIHNVLEILKQADADSFVIMDELGSGTDPAEGMGIAIAILEELRKCGANFLVTTHYPEVKEYASKTEHIVNARMTFDRETLLPTYHCVIGEAGESCAFYIADRLGMPKEMLKTAIIAAYGANAVQGYHFREENSLVHENGPKIQRVKKTAKNTEKAETYQIGDSVLIHPDGKIGIVCETVNEKGVLRVMVGKRKIYINRKRVELRVKAEELYPENYDMSIVFDTVKNRKIRHDMERKLTDETIIYDK